MEKEFLIADFASGAFHEIAGVPNPLQQSVMPVVATGRDAVRPVGTCFCISHQGIFMTAWHVIDDALGWTSDSGYRIQESGLAVLYVSDSRQPPENKQDLFGGLLPVKKVYLNRNFDVALLFVSKPIFVETGKAIPTPQLRLSPGLPSVGDACVAMGYRQMDWKTSGSTDFHFDVIQNISASKGAIKALHFPMRDEVSHNFPCFEIDARFDGGMSGAPIVGTTGAVVGVVCSSFGDPDGAGHISFGSLVGPCLALQLDSTDSSGKEDKVFLFDYVVSGSIVTDGTLERVIASRSEKSLLLDFGRPPKFEAHIGL